MAETTDRNLGCINGPNGDKGKYCNGSNGYQGVWEINLQINQLISNFYCGLSIAAVATARATIPQPPYRQIPQRHLPVGRLRYISPYSLFAVRAVAIFSLIAVRSIIAVAVFRNITVRTVELFSNRAVLRPLRPLRYYFSSPLEPFSVRYTVGSAIRPTWRR